MDIQPRQLVGYFRAGDLESILNSRTIWICASCYACTVRCPAGIKVTDLIYGLKRMALESRTRSRASILGKKAELEHVHFPHGMPIHALSEQFVQIVNRDGRNHELELMTRYLWRRAPHRRRPWPPGG